MTRQQGIVGSAAGLTPFGHLGWGYKTRAEYLARAAEYIADGLDHNQRVEYIGNGSNEVLRAELAGMPAIRERLDSVVVKPSAEHYTFHAGSDVIDAEATMIEYLRATEKAVADGYTGLRAVVDVTAVSRTPAQRDEYARLEFLIDTKVVALPISLLCGYDAGQLGAGASELVCLHPLVNRGATPFRLYTEPEADYALAGAVDTADDELFTTTLRRLWPLTPEETVVLDAQGLEFIGHRQLYALERLARGDGRRVVLRTDERVVIRLAELLDLTNLQVQPAGSLGSEKPLGRVD
jgi:hypothetical protein